MVINICIVLAFQPSLRYSSVCVGSNILHSIRFTNHPTNRIHPYICQRFTSLSNSKCSTNMQTKSVLKEWTFTLCHVIWRNPSNVPQILTNISNLMWSFLSWNLGTRPPFCTKGFWLYDYYHG